MRFIDRPTWSKSFPISSIFVRSFFLLSARWKNSVRRRPEAEKKTDLKLGSQLRLFLSRLDCQSCHQLTCFLSSFLTYTSTMHQYILYVHSSTKWCTSTERGDGGGGGGGGNYWVQQHWLARDINSVQIHWFYFTFINFLSPFWIGFIPFGLTPSAPPPPPPPAPSHSHPFLTPTRTHRATHAHTLARSFCYSPPRTGFSDTVLLVRSSSYTPNANFRDESLLRCSCQF